MNTGESVADSRSDNGSHSLGNRDGASYASQVAHQRKAKKRGPSPSARSVAKLTADGYLVGNVEQTIPHTFIKRDLYGFGDLLAIRRNEVLIVQATDKSNVSKRVQKITEHENVGRVREAGIRIEVWGWEGDSLRVVDLS